VADFAGRNCTRRVSSQLTQLPMQLSVLKLHQRRAVQNPVQQRSEPTCKRSSTHGRNWPNPFVGRCCER
jgi:hypothetical protein